MLECRFLNANLGWRLHAMYSKKASLVPRMDAATLVNRRELLRTLGAAGFSLSAVVLTAAPACASAGPEAASGYASAELFDPSEEEQIAREAYIYFYPLVTMGLTLRQSTNANPGKRPGAGPMNGFSHFRAFPDADWKSVVRPNFDTLYSFAYLDLSIEPMVVTVPDTGGRHYMLPMYDMWSDIFAVPGKRTTGTGPGDFVVAGPGWSGALSPKVQRIDAPTPFVWVIGRTQTNGPKDYEAVRQVQDGYRITPLSRWPSSFTPEASIDPSVDTTTPPLETVNRMGAEEFFRYALDLAKLNRPHVTDQPILARMRRLGILVGQSFDLSQTDSVVRAALTAAPRAALQMMAAAAPRIARVVNGWQMNTDTMGVYGTFYLKRAIVAMTGLGANLPEDAVYPLCLSDADGKPLNGVNRYSLHFERETLPPTEAFWSITMYDASGFQVANPVNRFALGDRDDLHYNNDGSLDIWIQHDSPGGLKESNWLPAPVGQLGVTMRIYAPKPEVLDGRWAPPSVQRLA
jgi:hypothetical protein